MILHEIETTDRSTMERLQLERLRRVVELVSSNVPFYREKFAKHGITSNNLETLANVKMLPFTTKKDLRDHYPFGLFAVKKDELVRVHASSGTSGKPTVVGYTQNDINVWSDLIARSLSMAGGRPGEFLHNAYGYGLFTGGLGLHYGSENSEWLLCLYQEGI